MSYWETGFNKDFTGVYSKHNDDSYTFIGYEEGEFHKYDPIDSEYFLKLISKGTIISMFPEMDFQHHNPKKNVFTNGKIKYFKCNEHLIMRKSGYEYVFEFDLPTDIKSMDINKISDTRYYFWCGGHTTTSGIDKTKEKNYYVNLEILGDKIVFHLKHLRTYTENFGGDNDFMYSLMRQINIYLDKFNDLDISKFESFSKSASVLNKFSL